MDTQHFPLAADFARDHRGDPDPALHAAAVEVGQLLEDRLAAALRRRDDALEIDRLTRHSQQLNAVGYRLHVLRHPDQAGGTEFQADIFDDLAWAENVITTLRAAGICK